MTGDVRLTGPLAAGGRYGFKTMSGDITLTMPDDSSFHLSAKVSNDGEIISDFPLTLIPDVTPPARSPQFRRSSSGCAGVSRVSAESPAPVAPYTSGASLLHRECRFAKDPTPAPAAKPDASPVIVKVAPRISKVIVTTPVTVSVSGSELRRVDAVCGAGDASIQVASFSGTLHLLKN